MQFKFLLPCAMLFALPLASCVNDGYEVGMSWSSHPYSGWYDDYYGPIYDGYWGSNGFFYYRLRDRDRSFRRDNREHFRRDMPNDNRFRRFEGTTRPPPRGTRMPSFPRQGGPDDRGRRRH